MLDFYRIDWDYEPKSFDIEWDDDGNVTQRFTPDFYLPSFDIYIEITTMNQKLVTKKNRKVRRLTTLYPDVRCKVLYQRDYFHLLVKYGLDDAGVGGEVAAPSGPSDAAELRRRLAGPAAAG